MKLVKIFIILLLAWVITLSLFNANVCAEAKSITELFPSMQGWTPKSKPDVYTPDNLFEYINGAADVFLSYDFQQLATVTFENANKHSFTVDIYRHSSERNGFGIYSQERSSKGPFLSIGTQGYYEQGVLNFLRGPYYVKMSGYDLGENDRQVLYAYAEKLVENLEGNKTFPTAVTCFPGEGKILDSESFISKNFLGHSFLHSAFTADYEKDGRPYQAFIIETKSNTNAQTILDNYLAFLEKKGVAVEKKENFYRFQDPYYRSSGKMNLKITNNYIWGLFSKNDTMGEVKVVEIEKELKKKGLIK